MVPATLPSATHPPARYKRSRPESETEEAAPAKRRNVAQEAIQTNPMGVTHSLAMAAEPAGDDRTKSAGSSSAPSSSASPSTSCDGEVVDKLDVVGKEVVEKKEDAADIDLANKEPTIDPKHVVDKVAADNVAVPDIQANPIQCRSCRVPPSSPLAPNFVRREEVKEKWAALIKPSAPPESLHQKLLRARAKSVQRQTMSVHSPLFDQCLISVWCQ